MNAAVISCAVAIMLALPASAQQIDPPTLTTYVLAPGTASFQAEDGWTVVCEQGKTFTILGQGTGAAKGTRSAFRECQPWTIGRHVQVWGKRNSHAHTVIAEQIQVDEQALEHVSGFALIDRVIEPETAGTALFRADGYALRASPKTRLLHADNAVTSLTAITTNMWVRYTGDPQQDGSVQVTEMLVMPNVIAKKETNLRTKNDFDAEAVTESDRQGKVNKFFLGLNLKRVPIHEDPAMQVRLQRVGESLIPVYQKALPATDPTRIPFGFHLVDLRGVSDAMALPSGIILVPYQIVEKLNDQQLAAVLAANVATVLQKQSLRFLPTAQTLNALNWAGLAGGLVVPGLGLATSLGTGVKEHTALKLIEEQDLREGMALLHDAGYDISAAPVAWWLIHSNPKKTPLPNGPLPANAAYCYQLLGTVWRRDLSRSFSTPTAIEAKQ